MDVGKEQVAVETTTLVGAAENSIKSFFMLRYIPRRLLFALFHFTDYSFRSLT